MAIHFCEVTGWVHFSRTKRTIILLKYFKTTKLPFIVCWGILLIKNFTTDIQEIETKIYLNLCN